MTALLALSAAYFFLRLPLLEAMHGGTFSIPFLMARKAEFSVSHYVGRYDMFALKIFTAACLYLSLCFFTVRRVLSTAVGLAYFLFTGDFIFLCLSETLRGVFLITRDGGVPEVFQYLKEAAAAAIFFRLYFSKRRLFFLLLTVFFLTLLIDDSLMFHEHAGDWIMAHWSLRPLSSALGIHGDTVGEVLAVFPIFIFFAGAFFYVYRNENTPGRRIARQMAFLIAGLLFSGVLMDVGVDQLETAGAPAFTLYVGILFEDFGEMIAMSLIVVYAATLWLRRLDV